MITVLSAHPQTPKSPFKHSKTIYVFTSGWVIVTSVNPVHNAHSHGPNP